MAADLANLERIKAERNRSVTAPHIAVVPDGLAPAGRAHPEEAAALMRIPEVHKKRTVVISQKAPAAPTTASWERATAAAAAVARASAVIELWTRPGCATRPPAKALKTSGTAAASWPGTVFL